MIDLHTHILPHLDDGARDMDEALKMAQMALDDGITTMVATPHGPNSGLTRDYSVAKVHERLHALQAALEQASLPLEVLPGTELYADSDLPRQLHEGEVLTYNHGHTLLLEFPGASTSTTIEQTIFALQAAGYRVVLAHPERLRVVQRDLDSLLPLIERGVIMQLTADALTGNHGERMQQRAEQMVLRGLVHVLASDAHTSINRPPRMAAARQRVAELLDEATAEAMVQQRPAALIHDRPLPPALRPPPRRAWFWGLLRLPGAK